jgi:hypothetical protein
MQDPKFNQHPHRCRLDWGRHGVRGAAARGDVIVIVDVLRFSSCVAVAVERGASVYPCAWNADAAALAEQIGGRAATAPPESRATFALVPTFTKARRGETIVLRTGNGAECTLLAASVPHVLAGALLNASAVARAITQILDGSELCATVVACGERRRWRGSGGDAPRSLARGARLRRRVRAFAHRRTRTAAQLRQRPPALRVGPGGRRSVCGADRRVRRSAGTARRTIRAAVGRALRRGAAPAHSQSS